MYCCSSSMDSWLHLPCSSSMERHLGTLGSSREVRMDNTMVDISNLVAGISNLVVDISNLVAGISNLVVGISNLVVGISNLVAGISNLVAGISNLVAGLSNLVAGISNLEFEGVPPSGYGLQSHNCGVITSPIKSILQVRI
jgi:prophage DNA circulation protein